MNHKALVTFASKYGSTAQMASKIAVRLKTEGIKTDLKPVAEVTDLHEYDAVILGSAIYIGQWRKEAVSFIRNHAEDLTNKKVWVFSTGPTGEGDPVVLLNGWKYPEKVMNTIEKIKPVDVKVFHGSLDRSNLNQLEKLALKMVKAPEGDFRDWRKIDEWTKKRIISVLKATS
jgi:menaquinone-dependent protoporphyrinogen oxidase